MENRNEKNCFKKYLLLLQFESELIFLNVFQFKATVSESIAKKILKKTIHILNLRKFSFR